ncbi:hypothetical protein [Cytobacillus praedii]|uniref:hypothetical protein n=1 Tax=Cytobacillus praedii TaxID=1742358 RepID=UPI002E245486|nr:hypothetical protein [Cytobacillus praedii]
MCIKCEIKKVALALVGKEVKKTVLGKLESGLIFNISLAENNLDHVKANIEAKVGILKMQGTSKDEAEEMIIAEYKEQFDNAVKVYEDAWNEVYAVLNVDPEQELRLDMRTGEIYKEETVDSAKVAEGVH